jgi:hypothetical protein
MKSPPVYFINILKAGRKYVTTIKGRINGHDLNIVVDSGAQRTIAHPDKVGATDNQVIRGETVNIRSGLSATLVSARVAKLPITFEDGTVINHDVVITDTLQEDFLMGADILKEYKAKIRKYFKIAF